MINANWLFLIIPGCAIVGYFTCAFCVISKQSDEMVEEIIDKAQAITKAKEDIIETFLNHADCEHDVDIGNASYPGHHDITYDIDRKGEAEIKAILEAL